MAWNCVSSDGPDSTCEPPITTNCDQFTVWPPMFDTGAGSCMPGASRLSPTVMVPLATWEAIVGESDCATATAPGMSTRPAPCCTRLAVPTACAVYWRIALTSGGVRPGFACSMSATVPETTGVANDVPLPSMSPVLVGWLCRTREGFCRESSDGWRPAGSLEIAPIT